MMQRVLITGASGFIGSHLCDKFISLGYEVVGLDNLSTGRFDNIKHLLKNPNFYFLEKDICDGLNISGRVDYVLHFASPASPPQYLKMPIETLKVGSYGVHNCLELAKEKGARILIASTSEVYGDPLVHPQIEDYFGNVNPIGERSVYDEAKRFQEAMAMAYMRTHGVDVRIVRIFNTYGERMRFDDGRVLPSLITQILKGENLTIYGDGSQTRSFCYISDLVEGIYSLLMSDYRLPMNLGNPEEISINDLAQKLLKIIGNKSGIEYHNLPSDDPKRRKPDISRAISILSWTPKIGLDEGLKNTIDYFDFEKKLT